MNEMCLYYDAPANSWEETLPIGNGSLGGMIFGGIEEEKIGLNEESLWSGYPREKNNPGARENLDKVRRLIFDGRCIEAEEIIENTMLGEYGECYLPLGMLRIIYHNLKEAKQIRDYKRALDLDGATASVNFTEASGVKYGREMFSSYPLQAMVIRLYADRPVMDIGISLESELQCRMTEKEDRLCFSGYCPEHVDPPYVRKGEEAIVWGSRGKHFTGEIRLLSCDGKAEVRDGGITVSGASEITLLVSAVKPNRYDGISSYDKIKAEHQRDYRNLFRRVELYLGEQLKLPTDKRLERLKQGEEDNGLYALYFQYGRYLLIASSREGGLPANLQGIWSWELQAPWSCNWTVNINLEMNYWPALPCDLAECMSPYFDLVERVAENGKKTADINYGCRGFTAHHNVDGWACTNPMGIVCGKETGRKGCSSYAMWPMGGAWLIQEFFRYCEYQGDETFLREHAYPVTRGAALFLLDWLVPHDGYYVTCPSTSPENKYFTKGGEKCSVTFGSAMDMTLVREVFGHFIEICRKLSIEDELLPEIEEKLEKLLPFRQGSYGQMLEWDREYEEPEPGHRHMSHLYGLFPGELFAHDEMWREACRTSLLYRLEHGGGHTGWSCAWIVNMFAVLGDGAHAWQYVQTLLKKSTLPNLWDTCGGPFQIDGNLGGTAGIANMLVQDRGGEVKVLPALPGEWKSGYVKGLRLKNRKRIDIEWNEKGKTYQIYDAGE